MKIYNHPILTFAPIKHFFENPIPKTLVIHTLALAVFTATTWPFLAWPLMIALPLLTEIILFTANDSGNIDSSKSSLKKYTCTKGDVAKIKFIINTLATEGKFKLLFQFQNQLIELGHQIENIHPLKVLEVIFSSKNLKEQMKKIRHDFFKWKNFSSPLSESLKKEKDRKTLFPHIDYFCTKLNLPKETILEFIEKEQFEKLINFLITS